MSTAKVSKPYSSTWLRPALAWIEIFSFPTNREAQASTLLSLIRPVKRGEGLLVAAWFKAVPQLPSRDLKSVKLASTMVVPRVPAAARAYPR